jgi:hypothetical protein
VADQVKPDPAAAAQYEERARMLEEWAAAETAWGRAYSLRDAAILRAHADFARTADANIWARPGLFQPVDPPESLYLDHWWFRVLCRIFRVRSV